jgi:SPX domain protein involved in polyphosphate accumulation
VAEIKKALKELRDGKAAVDNISPEVMKVDLDITANMLHPYLRSYGLRTRYHMTGDLAY